MARDTEEEATKRATGLQYLIILGLNRIKQRMYRDRQPKPASPSIPLSLSLSLTHENILHLFY